MLQHAYCIQILTHLENIRNCLLDTSLNAAKTLIPMHWKSTHVPTVKDWLEKVNTIYKMEETVAKQKETATKFHKMWKQWWLFTQSDDFNKANVSFAYIFLYQRYNLKS